MEWLKTLLSNSNPEWQQSLKDLQLPENESQAWHLIERKLALTSDQLVDAVKATGLEVFELDRVAHLDVEPIPESAARRFHAIAIERDSRKMVLACDNPLDDEFRREISFALKQPVELVFSPPEQIANGLNRFYAAALGKAGRKLWVDKESLESSDVTPEQAIARITQHILNDAVELGASDIHIQTFMGGGLVRFRVDGLLTRGSSLPVSVRDSVMRYILTQADLDISNHSTPQDGRLRVEINESTYDLRISYLPSHDHARLVIRLLNQERNFSLAALGLPLRDQQVLEQLVHQSRGLILFTGPTGSGKTTSLYSLLATINRPEVNIMTAEDPVEYQLNGISQIEVDEKRDRHFDTILKSMLRQDPDVILVGEIRDSETAKMAIRAVMTGHLVLSTLHTQDAVGAVQRLVDLGVSQGQLAECLKAVIGQRMARKVCTSCAEPIEKMTPLEQLYFDTFTEKPRFRAIGCEACHFSGYKGRFPLIEIYQPDVEARTRLRQGTYLVDPDSELKRDMSKVASQAIVAGISTVDEVTRVLGADYWDRVNPKAVASAMSLVSAHSGEQRRPSFLLLGRSEAWARKVGDKINIDLVVAADGEAAAAKLREDTHIVGLLLYVDTDQDVPSYIEGIRHALAWAGLPTVFILNGRHEVLEEGLRKHDIEDWCTEPLDLIKLKRLIDESLSY